MPGVKLHACCEVMYETGGRPTAIPRNAVTTRCGPLVGGRERKCTFKPDTWLVGLCNQNPMQRGMNEFEGLPERAM